MPKMSKDQPRSTKPESLVKTSKKADIERINAWGELQEEVWAQLMADFIPNPWGEGRPLVISSNDLRSSIGQSVDKAAES